MNDGNTGETPVVAARKRFKIPNRLFGGRLRTTTVAMCVAWFGLWMLYLYLNQDDEQTPAPQGAVVISDTPYVPYVPPADPTTAPSTVPETTGTTAPTTAGTPTSIPTTTAPPVTTTAPTTTQTPLFRLPEIPGIPGLEGGNGGDGTGGTDAPGQ
ncbi:hypothetical protein [Rhodococcus phenolicus]|uniref:hypothetical protein n=1 Tax=Rhodococcus phenolicus TaxID=263849 RepID=UPI000AE9FB31|nr:hypothetical protein [Rhodococcus phenolicus]